MVMMKNMTKKKVRPRGPVFDYQDRFPLVMGAILMAGLCCYYALKGGLLMGMTTANFYVGYFIFLFFIGCTLVYIRWEIRVLDRRCNWLHDWFKRFVFQAAYCWAAPSLALFLVYVTAHKLLAVEVLTSGLFEVDLPWILVLLLLVNLGYIVAFFFRLYKQNRAKRKDLLKRYRLVIYERNTALQTKPHKKSLESVYEVRTQKLTANFKYGDIVCFSYEEPYTYLSTLTGERNIPANEPSLIKVEAATEGFFRKVNRSMALPQHMLLACKRLKDGKLELQLKEPLNKRVEVSKESAPRLRNWILEAVGKIE